MPVITITNAKGGVGKSTIATNLAGYLTWLSIPVMLGDVDAQQSSREWLKVRSSELRKIYSWEMSPNLVARPPKGVTHAVLDTPAGLTALKLSHVLSVSNKLLIPLSSSIFDLSATYRFIEQLRNQERFMRRFDIALVGNRMQLHTSLSNEFENHIKRLNAPMLTRLRFTSLYGSLAANGQSLWDLQSPDAAVYRAEWEPITEWLSK